MTRMTLGSSAVRRFLVLASSSSIRIRIFQRVEFSSNFKIQIRILNNKNHQKNLDFSCPISKNRISRQISKKSNFFRLSKVEFSSTVPHAWNTARPSNFFQLFLEASNQKKLQHRPPQTNGWKVDLTHHTLISDKIWPRCQKQSHTSEIQLVRQIFSLVQASPAGSDHFFGPAFTKPQKFFKIQNDKMPDTQPAWRPSDAVVTRLQDEHAKYYPRSLVQLSPNH